MTDQPNTINITDSFSIIPVALDGHANLVDLHLVELQHVRKKKSIHSCNKEEADNPKAQDRRPMFMILQDKRLATL